MNKQEQIDTAYVSNTTYHIDVSTEKHPNCWMMCDKESFDAWKNDSNCGKLFAWKPVNTIYAVYRDKASGTPKYFHRYVTQLHTVDHMDRNGLNNCISNLREGQGGINEWNRPKQSNNTTGFKGVYYRQERNKFMAYINIDGKRRTLGHYDTPEKAHERHNLADSRRMQGFPLQEC